MSDPLAELLENLARGQDAFRRSMAWVETKRDPETPGLTAYRITGATRENVQHAINARMWEFEESATGEAHFDNPVQRIDGTWLSIGYTKRYVEAAQ